MDRKLPSSSVVMDYVNTANVMQPGQLDSGELKFDFEVGRHGVRVRKFTETGFQYNCDLAINIFRSAVLNHKRRIKK